MRRHSTPVNANLKMSIFAETECHFSAVSVEVYTALIHNLTCRLEARQALIYQLVLGLTGENGKYNYSRAVHFYPPFFDITCSAKNYKIAPALTTPIGWPCRDPRHHRFAMPNEVWDYKLRPMEFVIFSYLCCHRSYGSASVLTLEGIAKGVRMTAATVKKYRATLVDKGLVNEDGTLALKREDRKFFTLPNELFLLRLPPSAFVVYAFLLLIEDRRTHTCHPSYNTIAAATGLAKNTVMKNISALLETGLITVESSSYFDKHGMKWKGNNLYTILPVRSAVDAFHQRQFRQLDLNTERRRVRGRQEEYDRRRPKTTLCASSPAQTTPNPSPVT